MALVDLPAAVNATPQHLLSWLLWGCEIVLLSTSIHPGALLWIECRRPEIHQR
ncbi:hypothetical protein ACQP1O_11475 [Nocardia sp. CA-151230]|uniref:hypothetical protein n=1 Tax=Nocardia sp. CA-151230 TaxID=3239982 RepID=UPI003D89CC4D